MPLEELVQQLVRGPLGYGTSLVLGLLFGSFANVCIYRMPPTDKHPNGRSIVTPGSHCSACETPIRWYDNTPILSYLWLRGKCRSCGAEFSPRYLLVEAVTGMLFVAVHHLVFSLVYVYEPMPIATARFAILAAFVTVLVVITFIDFDHKLILDEITYPAIPVFYVLGLVLPERTWSEGLIGAVVGYGIIRLVSDAYYYLTGREGMGYGDGKLLAIVGALLGWQAVTLSLFLGSLFGSVISIGLVVIMGTRAVSSIGESAAGQDPSEQQEDQDAPSIRHVQVPFGPFLAAAAVAYLFMETWIRFSFYQLW